MLTIVGGPMFAGKTTWLLNYAKKLSKESYVIYKPNIDTRFASDACVSHNNESLRAINIDIKNPTFPQLTNNITTIFIDELNFFDPLPLEKIIVEQLRKKTNIVGVGLLYNVEKKPFGATLALAKGADTFIQLYARCDSCGKKANHTYRKVYIEGKIVLGAGETYGACCEDCWEKLNTFS